MAQENLPDHPVKSVSAMQSLGQGLLGWTLPDEELDLWLFHAPLLFSLLGYLGPINVLAVCHAGSALPKLLKSIPDILKPDVLVATILLDEDAVEDSGTATVCPVSDKLKLELDALPDSSIGLVLVDLSVSDQLALMLQGDALSRVLAQGAVLGLHGAERTPAGTQLVTRLRLSRPHLSASEGEGLSVFPAKGNLLACQEIRDQLGLLRALGRTYHMAASECHRNRIDAADHKNRMQALQERHLLLENSIKAQITHIAEQAVKLNDIKRAISILPSSPEAVSSARERIRQLRDGEAHALEIPDGILRQIDLVEALQERLDKALSHEEEVGFKYQALIRTLRSREAELMKAEHAVERMTQELAALARHMTSVDQELSDLRKNARKMIVLNEELSDLRKDAKQMSVLKTERQKLKQKILAKEARIASLTQSTSWRITAPMRALGKVLRQGS